MIGVLRGIRRRLLGSRRLRRYLLYAVGEVVLVVLGILIALQLNSWREARADRAFELTMLREIHTVLERDVVLLRDLFDRLDTSEYASERTLRLLVSSDGPTDSLAQALYEARTWIVLSFNRGPYDALKSTGIDKVSDDAVRSALVGMYDYRLPRVHSFLDLLTGRFHSLDDLSEALYTPVVETGEDGTLHIARQLKANRELLLATVPALVERRTSAVREARRRLTPLLDEVEHTLQLLAEELEGTPDRARANR